MIDSPESETDWSDDDIFYHPPSRTSKSSVGTPLNILLDIGGLGPFFSPSISSDCFREYHNEYFPLMADITRNPSITETRTSQEFRVSSRSRDISGTAIRFTRNSHGSQRRTVDLGVGYQFNGPQKYGRKKSHSVDGPIYRPLPALRENFLSEHDEEPICSEEHYLDAPCTNIRREMEKRGQEMAQYCRQLSDLRDSTHQGDFELYSAITSLMPSEDPISTVNASKQWASETQCYYNEAALAWIVNKRLQGYQYDITENKLIAGTVPKLVVEPSNWGRSVAEWREGHQSPWTIDNADLNSFFPDDSFL